MSETERLLGKILEEMRKLLAEVAALRAELNRQAPNP